MVIKVMKISKGAPTCDVDAPLEECYGFVIPDAR